MGAGKSTVGPALAARLGWPFVETDSLVEGFAGRSIAEIFAADGEGSFRSWEQAAVGDALEEGPSASVVAVGGGAVVSEANLERIRRRARHVVWLRARPETLAARVGNGAGRPLLTGDAATALVRLAEERRPMYEAVANVIVDVDDLTVDDVVDRVVAEVQ